MRFIHTSDIHYGIQPDADKPWSAERQRAVKQSLTTIVEECRKRDVDCLFISGNLFHHQPFVKDLKAVNHLFSTIPKVKVIIIAGTNDRIRQTSAVLTFPWVENVTYITSSSLTSVYFKDINTEIYGFSYYSHEIRENRLEGIRVPNNGRINILLAHGGDAKHLPFDKDELAEAGFEYVALGYNHKPDIIAGSKVVYSGSPEPFDSSDSGEHGFFVGEINAVSRKLVELEFIPVSNTQYISLVVKVSTSSTNTELLMSISNEISKKGTKNIYRIKIQGPRDPNVDFDLEVLQTRMRIAEIIDESEPEYDFVRLYSEHPSDIIGFYIRELARPSMSDLDKKALYCGINALLRTSDERG